MKMKGTVRNILAVLLWLCVWQLLAVCIHNQILLAGPVEVMQRTGQDVVTFKFWQTITASTGRIATGFLIAFALGSLFGVLAYRFRWLKELLAPLMSAVISVPVASFAVILLIWFGSGRLSTWISFLITFPNLYFQVLEGMGSTDVKLLELARVYRMPLWNQSWYLYRPALAPFIKSGCKVSIGMAWKSGVAAEIIGLPQFSIGEQIYMSKIYLDTAGVLSWTVICVLMSVIFEKVFLLLLEAGLRAKVFRLQKRDTDKKQNNSSIRLYLKDLSKKFGDKTILSHYRAEYIGGKIYVLMEPSGSGKTTFFRMLCGLEMPDEGTVSCEGHCAMAFQDNRFLGNLTATENLELTGGNGGENSINALLKELLPDENPDKHMSQYSGGMARRVEIIRCMLADAEVLLLDEPFAGLDRETREATATFIRKHQKGRIIMVATHSEEDMELLGAEKIQLK